ncbi:MAG: ABC transporter ATP-binding protein [Clostridia bacterium]|nr:ABC transporter ATP-binding protein [Clostridia bacterium]MDY5553926.1 ABC transporter ATP-binding protein [Blautia sp.]
MKTKEDRSKSTQTFLKVLRFIGRYRILLILSIVLAAVSVVLQLYIPVLFGNAIDQIVAEHQVHFQTVLNYLQKILVMVLLSSAATWIMNMINNRMTYQTVQDIRAKAIRQIQVLPLSYLDGHSTGDIISRVVADADILSDGMLLGFTQLFSGIVTIIVTLFFMFSKNFLITVMVIILTPISFFVAKFISTHSFQMFRKQSDARGRQTALIEEMIGSQKVVQAFGYEQTASQRFSEINEELKECSQKAVFYSSLTNPSTRFVNNIIYAFVALVGAFIIPAGSLTVGGLSVLLAYANQYMKPFNDISSVITELQNALACAGRIFDLLEETPESPDAAQSLGNVKGEVEIRNVSFRYEKDKKLIEDFNLKVKPGMRVAIVGPTGCGKTTFINLLMRFYDVNKGTISIDGKPVTNVTRHSLRSSFGMVLQDTWIKNGTVRENICIGKPDASEEEIIEAARLSHSWEFIHRLPKGLDTVLNEDSLSQGQKQLLCITRVMLCLPPMLILDEATSSIDTRTEMLIQEAFEKLMQGRTSFIVAHRLSTIRNADLILVMKDGSIIEQGTHDELIAQKGFYNKLYNSQFAGVSEN